jgi:hypothetical protein
MSERAVVEADKARRYREAQEAFDRSRCKGVRAGAAIVASGGTYIVDSVGAMSVTAHAEKDRGNVKTFSCSSLMRAW